MAGRPRYPQTHEPPPPPLPPHLRTVGQVVGETVKFYRANMVPSLSLGVGPALTGLGLALLDGWAQFAYFALVGGLLMTACFIAGTILVRDLDIDWGRVAVAGAVGVVVFAPAPILINLWLIPGVIWFSLVGLAVPAILAERLSAKDGLIRSVRLAFADFLHAFGTLVTLILLSFLFSWVLYFLLRNQGDAVRDVSAFVTLLLISPLLIIGSVLLYEDQVARLETPLARKERIEARRDYVATAPREVVAHRPGRKPRPAVRPASGVSKPRPDPRRKRPKPE